MRCIIAGALALLVTGCGEPQPSPQPQVGPAAAPAAGGPTPQTPSPIPGQGTVTKTLGGATVEPQDGGQGAAPGDMGITAAVRKAVMGDATLSARAKEVAVSTINGKVILRGTVATAAERSRIEILARDSCGAGAAIDNQVEVDPQR